MKEILNIITKIYNLSNNKEGDIVIAPNGDLYNCISGIGIDKFKICTYDEIINKPEIFLKKYSQFLENKFTDELCEDCKYLPICNGGCRYNIYINKVKKDCWKAFHNKVYEELLSLYFKYKEQVKI